MIIETITDFVGTLKNILKIFPGKQLTVANTGFVDTGKDFGSSYVDVVKNVKIAVLSGEPTSTLDFGEVWHFFEQQLDYPVSILDADYFSRVDLSNYDVLVLPDGYRYKSFLKENILDKIKDWVQAGGKLIVMGGAINGFTCR